MATERDTDFGGKASISRILLMHCALTPDNQDLPEKCYERTFFYTYIHILQYERKSKLTDEIFHVAERQQLPDTHCRQVQEQTAQH